MSKLPQAKVQLILHQPFFASLALGLQYIEDTAIETACTDGKELRYNPQFIDSLNLEETKCLLAHEVMHIANLHHTRRGGRDPQKWNVAADFAINLILVDAGFTLPSGGLLDRKYKDMSAEEIYRLLPDQQMQNPMGMGGIKDAPAKTQTEMQQIEAQTKQAVAQAAMIAKQQGKLPANIERLVAEIMPAKVNWKELLSSFLTERTRNDYSFRMPNKRFISQGLYLPSLESIEKGKFCLFVDTSGSIDNQLLNEFANEMQGILADSANNLTVMYIDTKINKIEEFEEDETISLKAYGGGGTDFKPGFEYLEKNNVDAKAVVYFTDGYCDSMPNCSEIPTLWACYGNKSFKPKFGEVIHL